MPKSLAVGENLTKSESGRESAKKSLKKVMWRGKCFGFTKPRLWGYFWQWGLLIQTHALPTVPVFVNLPGG